MEQIFIIDISFWRIMLLITFQLYQSLEILHFCSNLAMIPFSQILLMFNHGTINLITPTNKEIVLLFLSLREVASMLSAIEQDIILMLEIDLVDFI